MNPSGLIKENQHLTGAGGAAHTVDEDSVHLSSGLSPGSGEQDADAQHLAVKGLLWFSPFVLGFVDKVVFENPPAFLLVWTSNNGTLGWFLRCHGRAGLLQRHGPVQLWALILCCWSPVPAFSGSGRKHRCLVWRLLGWET